MTVRTAIIEEGEDSGSLSSREEKTPLSRDVKIGLAVIAILNFNDAIGYLAIMPTLTFYVTELGGSNDQYGLIISATSFASFAFMSVWAHWVDTNGNKYRTPFFVSGALMLLSNLMYIFAIVLPKGNIAVYFLMLARILYGMGGSGSSMAFPYLVSIAPPDRLTELQQYLSMSLYSGLAIGPLVNAFLGKVDTQISIWGLNLPMDSKNSVGLVLFLLDALNVLMIYLFIKEPSSQNTERRSFAFAVDTTATTSLEAAGAWLHVFRALASIKLWLPLLCTFVPMANYQLVEVAFPPASALGLNWGPVQISLAMGGLSIALIIATFVSATLSTAFRVPDRTMIIIGMSLWIIGGAGMLHFWTYPGSAAHFVVPVFVGVAGFPFTGPASRTRFTIAVASDKDLDPFKARLQALMGMSGEIASSIVPVLVSALILRNNEEVISGPNHCLLTPYALYIPVAAGLCIMGLIFEELFWGDTALPTTEGTAVARPATERTSLLFSQMDKERRRSSLSLIGLNFTPENESFRLRSSSIMMNGKMQAVSYDTKTETILRGTWRDEMNILENIIIEFDYSDDEDSNF